MKTWTVLVSISMVLLLTGCTTAAPGAGQSESAVPESGPAVQTETVPATEKPDLRLVQNPDLADSDGTVLLTARPTPLPNGDFGGTLLCVADRRTGKAQPLCGQAGCTHRTASCPAWRGPELRNAPRYVAITQDHYVDLFFYDGELQGYFYPKQGGEPEKTVWKAPEDIIRTGTIYSALLVDGNTVSVRLKLYDEAHQISLQAQMFTISPEGITQTDFLAEEETICSVWGREILILRQTLPPLAAETVEARSARAESVKNQLYFRDHDTGETRLLKEENGRWYMQAGRKAFYWIDAMALHTIEYATGQEYTFGQGAEPVFIAPQVELAGKLVLQDLGGHDLAVDYKTGALEPVPDFPQEAVIVPGMIEDCLILHDPQAERWSLWPVADYLNGVEPVWFDFSACDG